MKKVLALVLALVLVLSLAACGGSNGEKQEETTAKEEDTILLVGDTAETDLYTLKLASFNYLDVIPNGHVHYWGYIENPKAHTELKDLKVDDGYTFIKVDLEVDYKGKAKTKLSLWNTILDYDNGYSFDLSSFGQHDSCDGYYYDYRKVSNDKAFIEINDPLTFNGPVDVSIYFVTNDVVKTNTDKPLTMTIELPTTTGEKAFVFDLRQK